MNGVNINFCKHILNFMAGHTYSGPPRFRVDHRFVRRALAYENCGENLALGTSVSIGICR